MTLLKASTLFVVTASFVAAAMLSAAHPASAIRALSVTASAAQSMAGPGSDATATPGVALASMVRNDEPVYTTADLAEAVSVCTKWAPLCEKPAPSISAVRDIRDCLMCKNTCDYAWSLVAVLDRPVHELRHWRLVRTSCYLTLKKLLKEQT